MPEPEPIEANKIPLGCNIYVDETIARGYVLAVVKRPREASIRALARQAVKLDAALIVLERDQTVERDDRRWLFEELNKTAVRYEHRDRHEDALLWAADAIAWCWQHGGPWKLRVAPLISEQIDARAKRSTLARQREARATRLIGQAPGLTSQGHCPSHFSAYWPPRVHYRDWVSVPAAASSSAGERPRSR